MSWSEKNKESEATVKKYINGITIAVVIFIIGIFIINYSLVSQKAQRLQNDNGVLNSLITQKDADIKKLMAQTGAKEQELNALRKELVSVKQELSDTLKKLEAITPSEVVKKPQAVIKRK